MAAKIDKDSLKKNGFWIGLVVFFLFWAVALVVVLATNQRKKLEDEFQATKKKIDSEIARGVKSEEKDLTKNPYTKDWVVYGKKFSDHKELIWRDAWASQWSMYTWPEGINPPHPADRMLTPFEMGPKPEATEEYKNSRVNIDATMRGRYTAEKGGYEQQFTGLEESVYPAVFSGGFDAVFPKQQWAKGGARATHEEIIYAQEDFWVRREMLNIIRTTLDNVREMKEITEDKRLAKRDPKDKTPPARRIFRNAYWELDLVFKPAKTGSRWVISTDSTIKNISTGGKTLPLVDLSTNQGLPFLISQADGSGTPVTWRITGEPVPPNATKPVKVEKRLDTVDLKKPIRIHQFLFWEISPVRRIDSLALGVHSHRTVTAGLKVSEELKKLEPAPEATEGGEGGTGGKGEGGTGTGEGGGATGGMSMGGMGGMGGPPGMGGTAPGDATRVNRISRKRYMHVTSQTRHMPIALRLVVDESHIHDVLAAISNSRIRIQITQVGWHRVHDVVSPRDSLSDTGSGTGEGGTGGMVGPPGPGRPGMGMPRPGSGGMYGTGGMSRPGGGMPALTGPGSMYGGKGAAGLTFGSPGLGRPPQSFGAPGGIGGTGGWVPPRPMDRGDGTTPGEATAQFKDTARLVELSIYGIATLYESPYKREGEPSSGEKKDDKK